MRQLGHIRSDCSCVRVKPFQTSPETLRCGSQVVPALVENSFALCSRCKLLSLCVERLSAWQNAQVRWLCDETHPLGPAHVALHLLNVFTVSIIITFCPNIHFSLHPGDGGPLRIASGAFPGYVALVLHKDTTVLPQIRVIGVLVDHLTADSFQAGAHHIHLRHHCAQIPVGKVPVERA